MLVQCSSSLVMPVGTPSVGFPINIQEGFLVPVALFNHVLLHWLGGSGHADFFLHVVGDGSSRVMQLDSAGWQDWNHWVVCVGVIGHVVPREFVGIDIQLCGEQRSDFANSVRFVTALCSLMMYQSLHSLL